jgi:hypothetical protein
MPKPEYIEGPQALENFKSLATVVLQANPKKKPKPTARKTSKDSDKD